MKTYRFAAVCVCRHVLFLLCGFRIYTSFYPLCSSQTRIRVLQPRPASQLHRGWEYAHQHERSHTHHSIAAERWWWPAGPRETRPLPETPQLHEQNPPAHAPRPPWGIWLVRSQLQITWQLRKYKPNQSHCSDSVEIITSRIVLCMYCSVSWYKIAKYEQIWNVPAIQHLTRIVCVFSLSFFTGLKPQHLLELMMERNWKGGIKFRSTLFLVPPNSLKILWRNTTPEIPNQRLQYPRGYFCCCQGYLERLWSSSSNWIKKCI